MTAVSQPASHAAADPARAIRVLLVEDDEDDYVITRGLLEEVREVSFDLVWAPSCPDGLRLLREGSHDVVLLDYRLGEHTALDFLCGMPLEEAIPPVILLTGQGEQGTDMAVMRAGAADYLDKSGLNATMLERSIRYAVERHGAQLARHDAEQRFQMVAESVGAIVWQADPDTLRFTFVSREAEHLLGHPLPRWTGEPGFWAAHVHADDRDEARALFHEAARSGRPHGFEHRITAADGRVVWLRGVVRAVEFGGRRELAGVMFDVTPARAAEESLRLRDRALAAIDEGILVTDPHQPDRPIVYVNPAFLHMTGYAEHEVLGRNSHFLHGPDTDRATTAAIYAAIAAAEPITTELVNYRKDGTPYWNRLSIGPIRDAQGRLTHFVGVQRDVTEQRRAREALMASNALLNTIIEGTHDSVFAKDLDGRYLLINAAGAAVLGYSAGEIVGRTDLDILGPEAARVFRETDMRVIETGDVLVSEETAPVAAGVRTYHAMKAPLRDAEGRVTGLVGISRDISERKRMEEALEASAAHYRRLVNRAPQTIYAVDASGRFTELNPAGVELLGRPLDELLRLHFTDVIAPQDVELAGQISAHLVSGATEGFEIELRIRRPSGETRLVSINGTSINEGGVITGGHGIARDVTDERERESQMRLFAAALENLAESVNVLDESGRILYANAAHGRMLGHDPAAPPVGGFAAFAAGGEPSVSLAAALHEVRGSGVWRGRLALQRTDGQTIPVEAHMERVERDGRRLVFTICRDVQDELEREQRLRRAERLASIGTLVGGVAHELNNPLAAIVGFTQLLLMDERTPAERDDLETIRREAERMAEIVSNLRLLAGDTHREARRRQRLDLNDVVRHVLRTRAYALHTRNVEVREDLDPDLPAVLGDRGEMEQVLLNLVVNAEQAMAGCAQGVLVVRTRRSRSGVSLHVVDNGPGIAPGQLEQIFDPFFTTKAPGEGTGLGLSLVHSIVAEHGGEIQVDSRVGAGAAFRIDLPHAPEPPAPAPEGAPAAASGPGRPLRVLFVDDEEAVRRVISRFLRRRGHMVDEAEEGGVALTLLDQAEQRGASYDAILSDLRMPGLGGGQLLAALKERGGGLEQRLVFVTGDVESVSDWPGTDVADVPVLTKPLDLNMLAATLEEMAARG